MKVKTAVRCVDVARYILDVQGRMTAMKLQKLVYYCQAWSLVWDERPLFREPIQAWANGPVVPELYKKHRLSFEVGPDDIVGDPTKIDGISRDTINKVLEFYGPKSGQWLSELTHRERPWLEARKGLAPGERGAAEITQVAMAEYYGSLT